MTDKTPQKLQQAGAASFDKVGRELRDKLVAIQLEHETRYEGYWHWSCKCGLSFPMRTREECHVKTREHWADVVLAALADSPATLRVKLLTALNSDHDWEDREAIMREILSEVPESAAPAPSRPISDQFKPLAGEPMPPAPSSEATLYFATGYTKEDLRAMHPNIKLKLQNGEAVVVDAIFDHYGVGSQNEETAYLIVGSEKVVFPAKFVRERALAKTASAPTVCPAGPVVEGEGR